VDDADTLTAICRACGRQQTMQTDAAMAHRCDCPKPPQTVALNWCRVGDVLEIKLPPRLSTDTALGSGNYPFTFPILPKPRKG